MQKAKRMSAWLLAALMTLSVMPTQTFAQEHNDGYRVMNASEAIRARNVRIQNHKGEEVLIDGSKTAVGVLDDAIDPNHPALQKAPIQR